MPRSNEFIAGDSDADRFLMGLLRAFADLVLVASGVLRASPRGTWQPDAIYPPAQLAYAALRERLGASRAPEVAVLTGHGSIDPEHPLLESGALVLTSEAGADRLAGRLPAASTVLALGPDPEIDPVFVVDALRARGHQRILCEAGPHAFGSLLAADVVDELFLTTSPLLVGDGGPGSRFALVEGADLTPAASTRPAPRRPPPRLVPLPALRARGPELTYAERASLSASSRTLTRSSSGRRIEKPQPRPARIVAIQSREPTRMRSTVAPSSSTSSARVAGNAPHGFVDGQLEEHLHLPAPRNACERGAHVRDRVEAFRRVDRGVRDRPQAPHPVHPERAEVVAQVIVRREVPAPRVDDEPMRAQLASRLLARERTVRPSNSASPTDEVGEQEHRLTADGCRPART